MAAQTHGAVDSLLGLLSSAIKDEARLLGGVHGDVQFIKDEMDSMNGFLMHLTKTEGEHDDQLRAWMKQVRDIAYIAEDCIELYVRDLAPPGGGALAFLRHLPVYLWTAPARHRLATQIRELKVRVRDVGERRLRYGVNVPAAEVKPVAKPLDHDDEDAREARREAFLQALEQDLVVVLPAAASGHGELALASGCPSFSKAIHLLPKDVGAEDETIHAILEKCCPDDAKFSSMKMFLCALRVYPYATVQELKNLRSKLDQGADDPREQVRIFCYSRLSTQQKSCLQYLTAFLKEKSIARTSLVRRWAAEGLVAKEHDKTPEEVGERCFGELVFRGFVYPVGISDAGTVKSCNIDDSIREFIIRIAKSENFVSELPSHLERQLQIRDIVLRSLSEQWKTDGRRNIHDLVCCCRGGTSRMPEADADEDDDTSDNNTAANVVRDHPMDELVHFLRSLPEGYRLNVLDLGGCQGLKKRHIKSICRVVSLKYLSLRKTDVSRLRARHIQALRLLETLDIRETKIPPGDMKRIFLPKLKHLLAGAQEEPGLSTAVEVPRRIGMMRQMETLSEVQVSDSGAELEGVAKLPQLRKLGVVVPVNDRTTKYLCRVINGSIGLRSLSIRVTNDGTLDFSMKSFASFSAASLVLENLDIKGKFSLPPWISHVTKLRNITLCETELKGDLLGTLGNVKGLRCLRLLRRSYTDQSSLNFRPGQFKALKFLVVEGDNITSIAFEGGAAPMLEKIVWTIRMDKDKQELISGIQHLRSLKAIEIRGDGFDRPTHQLFANLKQAVAAHPNRPNFMCSSQGKVFEVAGNVTVTVD